jgi:hypothetical protein
MIRYQYNRQFSPPAPFLLITLRSPKLPKEVVDFPAQIDVAADKTVLPSTVVERLELVQVREIPIAGYGGSITMSPTFIAQVAIHDFAPLVIEALSSRGEPYVLLGRDVLNNFRLVLDGPQPRFEIA